MCERRRGVCEGEREVRVRMRGGVGVRRGVCEGEREVCVRVRGRCV